MRQWTKFRRMGRLSLVPLLLALILTLTIVACGGDDDTPAPTAAPAAPATAPPAATMAPTTAPAAYDSPHRSACPAGHCYSGARYNPQPHHCSNGCSDGNGYAVNATAHVAAHGVAHACRHGPAGQSSR